MDYKVRKGLETPLKIHRMLANYFYIYSAVGGVLGLTIFVDLSNLVTGSTTFISFAVTVFSSLAIFLGLRTYFISKSNTKRMKFDKKSRCISNRDLIKSIK